MMLCTFTKHAAIFGSLWLQYSIFPKGIYTAVLPVCEKRIGVIAIVEMCGKCSHFRLMLAVEETKIAQPETCGNAKNISLQRKLRATATWEYT